MINKLRATLSQPAWCSAYIALIALVFTQFPPFLPMIFAKKPEIILGDATVVSTRIGTATFAVPISIWNPGNKAIWVQNAELTITYPDNQVITHRYMPYDSDGDRHLLSPAAIPPGELWSETMLFRQQLTVVEEQRCSNIVNNIYKAIYNREDFKNMTRVDRANFLKNKDYLKDAKANLGSIPLINGEYDAVLRVQTFQSGLLEIEYHFTLYDTNIRTLKNYKEDYTDGIGLSGFPGDASPGKVVVVDTHSDR